MLQLARNGPLPGAIFAASGTPPFRLMERPSPRLLLMRRFVCGTSSRETNRLVSWDIATRFPVSLGRRTARWWEVAAAMEPFGFGMLQPRVKSNHPSPAWCDPECFHATADW